MLTKFYYAGLSRTKLIPIYCLFVRTSVEYCSVGRHHNLEQGQSNKIEIISSCPQNNSRQGLSKKKEDSHCDYENVLNCVI